MGNGARIPFSCAKACIESGRAQILSFSPVKGRPSYFVKCLDLLDGTKKEAERCPYRKWDRYLRMNICPCEISPNELYSLVNMKQAVFNVERLR